MDKHSKNWNYFIAKTDRSQLKVLLKKPLLEKEGPLRIFKSANVITMV